MPTTHATPAQHTHNGQHTRPGASPVLAASDTFPRRHIGPSEGDIAGMLATLGYASLDALTDATVPDSIRDRRGLQLLTAPGTGEHETLERLAGYAAENTVAKSFIGAGYFGTITPGVILRNILENPGWYTQYTPYQAEIAQGRLEALLNFQTVIIDLTGLPLAGASLLDESTAAAEAMSMCSAIHEHERKVFVIAPDCHPQTIEVCKTRAKGLGMSIAIAPTHAGGGGAGAINLSGFDMSQVCGVLVQYPTTDGRIENYERTAQQAHDAGALVVAATDLLALCLLRPPGEWGADIAVGSAQRFGVPMGFGGPHAGFLATKSEHVRRMPGRIIGVSRDAQGNRALRMAIQTREQHIKRERATSNICTAQALLAIMAGMYACYHGPEGLRTIARRAHTFANVLKLGLSRLGHEVACGEHFDTIRVRPHAKASSAVLHAAHARGINLRDFGDGTIGISCDECTTRADVGAIFECFSDGVATGHAFSADALAGELRTTIPAFAQRTSTFLTHPVFNACHSEHEMLRYITMLMGRDLSLAHSMIPLGSCTMKLNATSEMIPVTWPAICHMHPFAPRDQWTGYARMFSDLESWLAEITGFAATSLQPNSGAAGEYAGLMVIRAFHESRGAGHRKVCLIPESAHGTNPASAVCAGYEVVAVANLENGNIDLADLRAKAHEHKDTLAALMVTYPSTYGVFEAEVKEAIEIVHAAGGQVYMDGANMNAQVGLTSPGFIGADVCHLNLHKTFCIPHGGGGPGVGPICVARHLAPFLPGHPAFAKPSAGAIGPVAGAPYGSAAILPISWMYIAMMGAEGLKRATQVAILNANYMAKRLEGHYDVLFQGQNGRCAHEFILDVRPFEKSAGIKPDDIAKRLMDYGFHAPTMSWPVPGTLMFEPTESESKAELDRLCDAMIAIREEVRAIETGKMDKVNNPLKNAPHTMHVVTAAAWDRPYPREVGAFPAPWTRTHKFWPSVGRVDNPYGDRNLVCACVPMSEYQK